jgi:RHS repeat-associated protein
VNSGLTGGYNGYLYNAEGDRVASGNINSLSCNYATNGFAAVAEYILGQSGEQLSETDGSGNLEWSNVYANGSLLATYANNTTYFNLSDWLGTKRVVANPDGTVAETCLSLPFGDELNCTGADPSPQHFTGKERDSESGNDYFGARYYGSSMGRIMSPDPESATPLQVLNPQRWDKYSYGLNNPLAFTDSDGRDAAAVNFSKEIAVVGHEGIMSVTPDGTVRYARFGPVGGGRATGVGLVQSFTLQTKVQFDSQGNPTLESLNAVKEELGTSDLSPERGQDPTSIRLNYFKTTDQEMANLNQWITQQQSASNQGKSPRYNVLTNNCADFCIRGLVAGSAISQARANHMSFVPNTLFDELDELELDEPNATVTTSACDTLPDGTQRCY